MKWDTLKYGKDGDRGVRVLQSQNHGCTGKRNVMDVEFSWVKNIGTRECKEIMTEHDTHWHSRLTLSAK